MSARVIRLPAPEPRPQPAQARAPAPHRAEPRRVRLPSPTSASGGPSWAAVTVAVFIGAAIGFILAVAADTAITAVNASRVAAEHRGAGW